MHPAKPAWPGIRGPRAMWALLAVLLEPWGLAAIKDFEECTWQVVLNKFERIGEEGASDRFFHQDLVDKVGQVFRELVDAPIDPSKKYLGFPYYLKINYSCEGQASEDMVRKGHLTGLKPMALVSFQSAVNFYRWKIEHLQIQMEAAPFRSKGPCSAEQMCSVSWYTPMPIKSGSLVMRVDISGNGLGPFIPPKRFYVNINGFLKKGQDNKIEFTVGDELRDLQPRYFVNVPSRPLWHTMDQSPVLILGGFPDKKSILLTDTNFKDFSLVQLSIDSCWVGSLYCPQSDFTATIYDAISTESTLFIRQNQLVYYFTGSYSMLQENTEGSEKWVRVLASECIKRLCPVYFHSKGMEYVIALTAGKNEGYFHFGTITDGDVSFEMLPRQWSVCQKIAVANCSMIWALFLVDDDAILLLVEEEVLPNKKLYHVVSYHQMTEDLKILYTIPEFIPDARGLEFLMMLGTEVYTSTSMVPRGMFFNPYNNLLFIWGNFLLQSYNKENFIYLADFPKELSIKYLANSLYGELAIVTDNEEIWYLQEGSYQMYRLFPSQSWELHISLQAMFHSSLYSSNETMVTLFYEDSELFQLVYLINDQQGRLVKRPVPVVKLLMYEQHSKHYYMERRGGHLVFASKNTCPFMRMRLHPQANQQVYSRQELYRARPPHVLEPSGFHTERSLAVYQGLVYYLLWLHSKYDKPYADSEHDPIWPWWISKKQDQDYYFYLGSNGLSAGGVHIDMNSYEKIYKLRSNHKLPERIFLDKGSSYRFTILLTARGHGFKTSHNLVIVSAFHPQSRIQVGVVLADPSCVEVTMKQETFTSRNLVLFRITLKDKMLCLQQGISGHYLLKTSMTVKVLGSSGNCFQNTHLGLRLQGNLMVPVLIGCPPGKRLALNTSYTIQYNYQENKHYFDCMYKDPEMPCFFFRDIFYPIFSIQDLVTGDSGKFQGSFVLKVVGGGQDANNIRDYSDEEIYRYNSPLDNTRSLIWTTRTARTTKDSAFHIMSPQNSGIEWLCLENSPCHDVVPNRWFAPEFYFKVLVSNRGVDTSTYCDYQLIFLLHIHGLPLSGKRALFIVIVSTSLFLGLVAFYIIICLLWPLMVKACNHLLWKINSLIAWDSYYSYTNTSGGFTIPSQAMFKETSRELSKVSSRGLPKASSKVAEKKFRPQPTLEESRA
ncbi:cation channel sperm-associated protein subunit gamma-like [Ochotona curzoniae]|uniref:cation channel sperm-associated protein subunit gamma-like n=1 Tax=Ochotona curzoniae TaxID=130825 RepID=UPI001B346966|nr:cation channel sperm-associated protein subunit gamma-like [Ochotona curzoniae]